jgi:hypothetical protein
MKTAAMGTQASILCVTGFVLCVTSLSLCQVFTPTGSMDVAVSNQTSTLLNTLGEVLITGGYEEPSDVAVSNAQIWNPATGQFTATAGPLTVARYGHTATLLPNGMVLIAGGATGGVNNRTILSSAELYNPATGKFTATGSMNYLHYQHTATLLPNGTVLIAGGCCDGSIDSEAEIYNPSTGAFTKTTGLMVVRRSSHSATLLEDGQVLLSGGSYVYVYFVNHVEKFESVLTPTCELYNPSTGEFTSTGSMPVAVADAPSALLYSGDVLVAGGINSNGDGENVAELYNPTAGTWTATGNMNAGRYLATTTLLNNGQVLVAGGYGDGIGVEQTAEIYDPPSGTFFYTGSLVAPLYNQNATLLTDGYVLLSGGNNASGTVATAEQYSVVNDSPPENGSIDPKYVVVGVIYSPPGAKSSVSYQGSTLISTATSLSGTFSTGTSESLSVTAGANIFGTGNSETGTASTSFTQEEDTSQTETISQTTTSGSIVTGPLSSTIGVDHAYDVLLVWLNPKLNIGLTYNLGLSTPGSLIWGGYSYDNRDPAGEMEVIPMYVSWLQNPSSIPGNVADYLQRSWDPVLGAMTTTDYNAILQRDPFISNPSYNPNSDPTYRFDLVGGKTFTYEEPPAGDSPYQNTLQLVSQETSAEGQGASDTYSVGFSLDSTFTLNFLADIKVDLKNSSTTTWTNKWSEMETTTVGETATLNLTGPATTDNYQGPTEMQVWRDNVYGSFMFYPVLAPSFTVTATPTSRTVTTGGQTTYTVTTAEVDGLTGTVTFSALGLPTGVTASFSPASASLGSSTTATITASSTTTPGTYQIFLEGTSGALTFYSAVTLIVNEGPNFSITATPATSSVAAGGNTTYSACSTPINGFTGTVDLTVVGLPDDASASFNPETLPGSGCSTLTVYTSTSTPGGSSTLTISGVSGSLTQSATVGLVTIGNSPSFTLTVSPEAQGVTAGQSASYTVASAAVNGFDSVIALSVSGLPSGATGTFSPTSITGTGTSTLKVSTSSSTPDGGFTFSITGTSGSLIDAILATITINP